MHSLTERKVSTNLAKHCVEKKYVMPMPNTSTESILNTNQLKLRLSKYWCIPMENAHYYVGNMDDIYSIFKKTFWTVLLYA